MFHDRDRHATRAHETALACLEAGIEAALPERVVAETVDRNGETLRVLGVEYDLASYDERFVLGGGKAAGGVAAALEELLGDRIDDGIVVTTDAERHRNVGGPVTFREGDHPSPTERNVRATGDLLELAESADEETLVLAIVTGGASALSCAPAGDLTLEDLQGTTDALLASGATIDEVNAVRKHCSAIKGGRLATVAAPATVVTLAISDVVGDDPAVIGSGPTVPDPTTFADARAVLDRYGIEDAVPGAVSGRLEAGVAGEIDETPDRSDPTFTDVDYHLLARGRTAIDAARDVARERGYETLVLASRVRGEAREVGRVHAAIAEEVRRVGDPIVAPAVVLSGGEVTVTVRGEGSGGPNQELALAAGIEFAEGGTDGVLASVDTDGVDGSTDAAGAIVDGETVAGSTAEARASLAENDAGTHLAEREALLKTGYTGTNVNDLRVLVVDESKRRDDR